MEKKTSVKQKFNLEDRACVFLMSLLVYLAMQAGLFFKLCYRMLISKTEQISDVINSKWNIQEYIFRKIGSFGWVIRGLELVSSLR